ncbi:MAG: PEP-CTERM sorting domain-containing protein [Pirellulales bacterium]|nr:PEP-CTERM sorting domain-containing protein [Pirellulales bacterium]
MIRTIFVLSAALVLVSSSTATAAPTMYGSLGNFDAINDTGSTAHGFEIELDGCLPSDIAATFGAPYNRYGDPSITTDGKNTFVRYQSAYDQGTSTWKAGTDSGPFAPTGGHSLFFSQYGGDPNYPNVPGDHFGVALNVNPTNTIYRWLLDGGGGTLVAAGSNLKLPAPILNLVPPANPVNPVAVQVVIQPPPPINGEQWGEAIWAKVFTTEVENPEPVELEDLVLGNAVVPPDSETEIEWHLLQTDPQNPGASELDDERDVANGNESVTRRYEFYAYTGPYDPETHEADDTYNPDHVGAFLGNQNVAANMVIPEPSTFVLSTLGVLGLGLVAVRKRFGGR